MHEATTEFCCETLDVKYTRWRLKRIVPSQNLPVLSLHGKEKEPRKRTSPGKALREAPEEEYLRNIARAGSYNNMLLLETLVMVTSNTPF